MQNVVITTEASLLKLI